MDHRDGGFRRLDALVAAIASAARWACSSVSGVSTPKVAGNARGRMNLRHTAGDFARENIIVRVSL